MVRRSWRGVSGRFRALLVAAAAGGAATAQPAVPAHAAPVTSQEQAAWDRARGSGSAAAFQRYLELYPTGQYAELAFKILVEKSWRAPTRSAPSSGLGEPSDVSPAQALVAAQSLY